MAGLVVKPRARILHGHDWVFSGEVLKVFGDPADGDVISLKDGRDRLLGSAIYNSKSQIVARRFSRRKQDLDLDFFQRRIAQAIEYRARRGIDPRLCRLVWSESDGLPGVIVDRYGDHLVLQTLTLAMDQRKELIVRALEDRCRASARLPSRAGGAPALQIIERNDAPVRRAEGMELQQRDVARRSAGRSRDRSGRAEIADRPTPFAEDRFLPRSIAELRARRAARQGTPGARLFHQPGRIRARLRARRGERSGRRGSGRGEHPRRANKTRRAINCRCAGSSRMFSSFSAAPEKADEKFDLIILDPPSFTKTKGGLHDALRGYKELHVRAFKLLSPDGLLATFSCSHHVGAEIFEKMIADALVDARRSARRLRRYEQALDHPVLPTFPETEYFRGMLLEMMPGR